MNRDSVHKLSYRTRNAFLCSWVRRLRVPMQIHATPSTRLEGRLLYSERCRSRSSVSRHVVSAVVWPGAWFGGKNARPCLTEKAVDDPLTFSGRGHQGHIYIWTPLDVLWKDIRFLLELVFVLE